MPRTPSLRTKRDFERVMSSGTRVRRGCLQVFVAPAQTETHLGLAVRVPAGSSVVRNRARRRLRAAFERCTLETAPVDIVVQADHRVTQVDFQELVTMLCGSIAAAAA